MASGFPIKIEDIWIRNSEAFYQALKYPSNPEIQRHILRVRSPIFAKNVSRKYKEKARKDWPSIQYKVMRFCIEVKLIQNLNSFSKVLLSTDDQPIVEFSKRDKVWGAVDKGSYYEGINALGRLLMEAREKLRKNPGRYEIDIPELDNLILLGIDLKEYFRKQCENNIGEN